MRKKQSEMPWYKNSTDKINANQRIRSAKIRERNKQYVQDYLSQHSCVDCGNDNPIVLDFDHITDNKLANVSRLATTTTSLKRIQEEINKCEIRCSNCHRIVTHLRKETSK